MNQKEQNTISTKKIDSTVNNEHNVGYPDISKADTRTVVIISLTLVTILFLLSVFLPPSALKSSGDATKQSQTSTTIQDTKDSNNNTEQTTTEEPHLESTTEHTTQDSSSKLLDMG